MKTFFDLIGLAFLFLVFWVIAFFESSLGKLIILLALLKYCGGF